jgi:hypothetical protein
MDSNTLTRSLLLAISERYQPACLMFRLNVIVAMGKRGCIRSAPNGSPDLIGAIQGHPVAIEIKAGKDRLSPAQRAFRDAWQRSGGIYIVARDVDLTMCELAFALEGR